MFNTQKIQKILSVLVLFLLIYGPPFRFLPVSVAKTMICLMFPLLILLMAKAIAKCTIKKWLFTIYMSLLFFMLVSVYYPIFHGTGDFSVVSNYLRCCEAILLSLGYYHLFLKNKDLSFLCESIVLVTALQSLLILLMFISPEIRDIIFSLAKQSDVNLALFKVYGGFRGLGFAVSTVFDMAVILSIGMILASYMVLVKGRSILFYSFTWIINFMAVMMAGRTGLLGVVISLLVFIFAIGKTGALKRTMFFVLGTFFVLAIMLVCLLAIMPANIIMLFNDKVIAFAFEIFINYSESGTFETTSTNELQKMYFPIPLKTFLIGDGYYMSPNSGDGYYMGTDAGYMRHILFYGIFPSLVLYFLYIMGFLGMAKKVRHDKLFATIMLMIGGYFFIVHYKGDFLVLSSMVVRLFFILLVYLYKSKNLNLYNGKNIYNVQTHY